jgi:hypothetical protein
MTDAASLTTLSGRAAPLRPSSPGGPGDDPMVWTASEAPAHESPPAAGPSAAAQQPGQAGGGSAPLGGPRAGSPGWQPLVPQCRAPVPVQGGGTWGRSEQAAPVGVPQEVLRECEARCLQKGAEILEFSRRLGLLDSPLMVAPPGEESPPGPQGALVQPGGGAHSTGGSSQEAAQEGLEAEGAAMEGLTQVDTQQSAGKDISQKDASGAGVTSISGRSPEEVRVPLGTGSPPQEAPRTFKDQSVAVVPGLGALPEVAPSGTASPPPCLAAQEPAAPVPSAAPRGSPDAVLASPPNEVVPELNAAALLGLGELRDDERVPIWNRRAQRKLTGRCGPMRKNLQVYLEKVRRNSRREQMSSRGREASPPPAATCTLWKRERRTGLEAIVCQ